MSDEIKESIRYHEEKIQVLREREANLKEMARKAVIEKWEYTVTLEDPTGWQRIYDPSVKMYRVSGRMINREEWEAAGNSSGSFGDGGHSYLFNTKSGEIVCSTGGGNIYFGFGRDKDDIAHLEAVSQLSDFLCSYPEGGNIDYIIDNYNRSTK
jgi:hypothetical protein